MGAAVLSTYSTLDQSRSDSKYILRFSSSPFMTYMYSNAWSRYERQIVNDKAKFSVSDLPTRQIILHAFFPVYYLKSRALLETRRPMISPNNPNTEEKISITRIFTNLVFD